MGTNPLRKLPQVLLVGQEGSGKTTLVSGESSEEPEPTQAYNRVEKCFTDKAYGKRISVWDVSGKDALRPLWNSYYKNIAFSGVIYVIDSNTGDYEKATKDIHYLTNEEELRDAAFLVLFNMKNAQKGAVGRNDKELSILIKRHEMHLNTRINFFEFDFKGYNDTAKDAFTWLNNNIV